MKRDTMHVNTKGKRRRNRNFNESWNTDLPGASKNGSNIESNVDTQGFSGFVRTRSSYRQACIENMGMCRSPEQNSSVASHGNYGDATIHNNIAASNTMNYSEDRATCDGYKENMCFIGGDEVLSSHLGGRNRGKSGCRMLQDITNVAVNLQSKCDVAATSEGRVLRRSSYRLARMQNQGSITNTSGSIDAVMLGSGETQPNQLSAYSGKQELYKQIRFEFNKETYSDDDSSLAGVEEPEGCLHYSCE